MGNKTFSLYIDVFSAKGKHRATYGEWHFATEAQAKAAIPKAIADSEAGFWAGERFRVRIMRHEAIALSEPQLVVRNGHAD